MGYDTCTINVSLRLDAHGGDEQLIDRQEAANLEAEIRALIARIPAYRRIASAGVWRGV